MRKTESSKERTKFKIALILTALLAYPALIHASLAYDRPLLVAGGWLVLSASGLLVAARRGRVFPALLFAVLLTAGFFLWWWGEAIDLMYLPPVLINIAFMFLFGRTLLPGATPLIARVAASWRGPLDAEVALYTRRVTFAWTVLFAVMALESMALAMFAPFHVWSLFTNCLNYLFVLFFLVVEYHLRFHFLPHHEHLSFVEFCRLLARTDFHGISR